MVLLRMNGEGTDDFLNRRNEVVVMLSLHRAGLIPPLFLEVANGLCYGYVPGRPLTVKDMKVCTPCQLVLQARLSHGGESLACDLYIHRISGTTYKWASC